MPFLRNFGIALLCPSCTRTKHNKENEDSKDAPYGYSPDGWDDLRSASGVGRETNTWERLAEQGSKPGWAGSGGFQRPEFRRISLKETMRLDTRKNPDSGTNFAPCPSATLKKTIPVHALSRRVAGAADERETQKRCPIGARLFWSD